jgi:putative ABC transport system permease protein
VLLTAAGLLARSVVHLRQLDIGFAPTGLLAFEMSMPSEHMRELDARALLDDSARAIAEVPGVASVSQVSLHPLQGPIGLDSPFQREEQSREEAKHNPYVNTETIAPSYFATMRTPIVSGRGFTNDDRAGTTPVVILSQRFAQLAWPGQSALGKRLHVTALDPTDPPGQTMWTVIGTVGDIRYRALTAPGITVYAPVTQSPDRASEFMVRASAPAAVVIPAIRSRLLALNRNGIVSVAVMDQVLRVLEAPWYANLALFAAFAVISMLLATVGLYAMLAYSVVMQRREIGVRLVLGATAGRIALDIVADGARIIVAGSLIGVAMAIALLRLMAAILFGVSPTDPLTLVTAPLLFAAVAAIACAVPALRAARTEPAICLRAE